MRGWRLAGTEQDSGTQADGEVIRLHLNSFDPPRVATGEPAQCRINPFAGKRSSLPTTSLKMSDSWGLALQAGVNYAIDRQWGLFASAARIDVKSDVEAVATMPGVPVPVSISTKIDFRPWTYQVGASYRF